MTEIGEALPAELSGSAIRAMLKRLEAKGFVVREASDRGFLYAPSVEEKTASKSALTQVVRVFFNGSATSAAAALLGMQDKMSAGDLDELEKLIAEAREGRTK
ncbi:BlaI/MecI/CopY family transcriptional regulator [Sphingopyxis terrae]|uniref:BlaI/MecI/CopY family transcriptional regulator n=1 Tax=Sphingopyxis terrae TaxID=33052 RepID=UPI001E5852AE|nr:BlaI/MecI/CopY family transcriptional regulator [Sphingopyxis terrae]